MKTQELTLLAATLFFAACGADMAMDGAGKWDPGEENYKDTVSAPDEFQGVEEELELDLQGPQASLNYVYVVATARDSVVRIDASNLAIRIIPVGGQPTTLATLPESDAAVVINSGTRDLSIIRSEPNEDRVTTLDILPYANTISVSPDGRFALVYYSDLRANPGDPVGDFQTLAVVALEEDKEKAYMVSTGFHITRVFFHDQLDVAYIVTDDGVGVLQLDKLKDGAITPIVDLGGSPMEEPNLREVLITPDGSYAVVRYAAEAELRVVDLATEEVTTLELDSGATDLDLVPGSNQVLVVLKAAQKAVLVSLSALFDDPENAATAVSIPGFAAGTAQVSPDGKQAVLYTTLVADKPEDVIRSVGILDMSVNPPEYRVLPVQKPILAVAISPRSRSAILFHETEKKTALGAGSVDQAVAKTQGVTVLDLETGYRKLIQTNYKWSQHLFVSTAEQDQQLFLLTPDPADINHQMVALNMGSYIKQVISLVSAPSSMVYVPLSNKVAVAQDHPAGRISFVDGADGSVFSVTGYEIAGFIH